MTSKRNGFCPACGSEQVNIRGTRLAGCSRDAGCSHLVEAYTKKEIDRHRIKRYGLAIKIGKRRGGKLLYGLEQHKKYGEFRLLFARDTDGEFQAVRKTKRSTILDRFRVVGERSVILK